MTDPRLSQRRPVTGGRCQCPSQRILSPPYTYISDSEPACTVPSSHCPLHRVSSRVTVSYRLGVVWSRVCCLCLSSVRSSRSGSPLLLLSPRRSPRRSWLAGLDRQSAVFTRSPPALGVRGARASSVQPPASSAVHPSSVVRRWSVRGPSEVRPSADRRPRAGAADRVYSRRRSALECRP